jgi:hypothetical protein
MDSLNLKSGRTVRASIRVLDKDYSHFMPVLEENALRFVGSLAEIHFKITDHSEFDLTVDVLNTNKEKINKIDLFKQY